MVKRAFTSESVYFPRDQCSCFDQCVSFNWNVSLQWRMQRTFSPSALQSLRDKVAAAARSCADCRLMLDSVGFSTFGH